MRGEHLVTVANNRVKFKLNIRRNLTILQGNSASGKTTLLELIDQFDQLGPDSGVSVVCDAPVTSFPGAIGNAILKKSVQALFLSMKTVRSCAPMSSLTPQERTTTTMSL